MKTHRFNVFVLLLILLFVFGCATGGGNVQPPAPVSQEAVAFKAVSTVFEAYDMSMTALRILEASNLITFDQFNKIKKDIAWPLYNSIVAADVIAQRYATAPAAEKQNLYDQLTQALAAVAAGEKELATVIKSIPGGK